MAISTLFTLSNVAVAGGMNQGGDSAFGKSPTWHHVRTDYISNIVGLCLHMGKPPTKVEGAITCGRLISHLLAEL